MKVDALTCPACGARCHGSSQTNQPFVCETCGSTLVLTDLLSADQVLCPACGTRNQIDTRFCAQCGATLKTACPFCLTENRSDAVHCRTCGANLQQAWQRKRAWLEKKRQFDQRRQIAECQAEEAGHQAELKRLITDLDEPYKHPLAIYCLQRLGERAVEALIVTLRDDDPDARFGAARTLGLIGDTRAVPALVQALADTEPAVRYWSVDALGRLGANDAAHAIGALLSDLHDGVAGHAAEVLQQLGTPEAEAILHKKRKRGLFG